jgi:hypothetical protein
MAITIRNITDEQIQMAKDLSGKGTASAGVVACIDIAARSVERTIVQDAQIRELKEEVAHLNRIMERLASAADEALCIVRQKELLR